MFKKTQVAGVVALMAGSSISIGADAGEVVNKFLKSNSKSVVEVQAEKLSDDIPIPRQLKSKEIKPTRKRSVRVAQKPKSVLQLSEERVESVDLSRNRDADAEEAKLNAEAKRIESSVERKMQSLERSLKREEKRLESRLEELAVKRTKALEQGSVETLKRIEKSEKQAITDYDKRVERLLSAVARTQPAPIERAIGSKVSSSTQSRQSGRQPQRSSTSSRLKKTVPSWNRQKTTQAPRATQPTPKPQPQQKRRFKLWPFR